MSAAESFLKTHSGFYAADEIATRTRTPLDAVISQLDAGVQRGRLERRQYRGMRLVGGRSSEWATWEQWRAVE